MCAPLFLAVLLPTLPLAAADLWEIHRDEGCADRPDVVAGTVTIDIDANDGSFPRHLNELGITVIRLEFTGKPGVERKLSLLWSGGSEGTDQFEVRVDGFLAGRSTRVESSHRPYEWTLDEITCRLGRGKQHVVEISTPESLRDPIQFSGIRMAKPDAPRYQPICYASIGGLAAYEKSLGGRGVAVEMDHLTLFAPKDHEKTAKAAAKFLDKAYRAMREIYGRDTPFRFSVENYPDGHERGWGGISGAATIGYPLEALERFGRFGTRNIRGFAGYTEEMSHGFKGMYRCGGTYEALGVAVQDDVLRRLVPEKVVAANTARYRRLCEQTYAAYRKAGNDNPDPDVYPWNVIFTRILNKLFFDLREEYGPEFWPDFFRMLRQLDYPLHRAKKTERMGVYADIFSTMFLRDMRAELTAFGIDIDADPPWGWETHGKK